MTYNGPMGAASGVVATMVLVLLFGENPQAVAYSAQPVCWSGSEISSPTTHRGAVRKDGAEIP